MDQQRTNRKGLSPNQTETKKFPVVGEEWPSTDIENWRLRVSGLVKVQSEGLGDNEQALIMDQENGAIVDKERPDNS